MLTNQHVEVDHKLVDMSTSFAESLLAGAMRRLLFSWGSDSGSCLVFALPPVVRFVELLALCEVERNGERDERRGFKRHDVEDNGALTVRSPLAGTGCACGAVTLVRGFAARCRNCPV